MKPGNTKAGEMNPASQWRYLLLTCGIIASLLYIAMNIFIPMFYPGYNAASQVVSEISAIGAPTRTLWVIPGILYSLLVAAFGWGIRLSADKNRYLKILGTLMIISGLVGLAWSPMHRREVIAAGGGSFTDTWHIVMTFITLGMMLLLIGFGAAAMGKSFRTYSFITLGVFIVFGVLTWLQSPGISSNSNTPLIGVWERINIAAYMGWMMVLAVLLLRRGKNNPLIMTAADEKSRAKVKSNGRPYAKTKQTIK
ncbi:MAG TPA: DUF998 domain-containing protein [Flavisolibacter sp.]|nr:DUF998 domain-containing protein [Flavisolibacter sp.]